MVGMSSVLIKFRWPGAWGRTLRCRDHSYMVALSCNLNLLALCRWAKGPLDHSKLTVRARKWMQCTIFIPRQMTIGYTIAYGNITPYQSEPVRYSCSALPSSCSAPRSLHPVLRFSCSALRSAYSALPESFLLFRSVYPKPEPIYLSAHWVQLSVFSASKLVVQCRWHGDIPSFDISDVSFA